MPQVYRINQGKKVSIFVTDDIWAKIQKKPKLFGVGWELIPIPKSSIHKNEITDRASPIYSGLPKGKKAHDDLGDAIPEYTENDYRKDLKDALSSLKIDDKGNALFLYKRAYKFKESIYVKTKIKILS